MRKKSGRDVKTKTFILSDYIVVINSNMAILIVNDIDFNKVCLQTKNGKMFQTFSKTIL
jgi:hypothetical protein